MFSGWHQNHAHIGNMISNKCVFKMKRAQEVWRGKYCMDGGLLRRVKGSEFNFLKSYMNV